MASSPELELFLCQHETQDDAREVAAVMVESAPETELLTTYLLLECAYDDFDLTTSAREVVNQAQSDFQGWVGSRNAPLHPDRRNGFYDHLTTELKPHIDDINLLFIDGGRYTDTAESLARVTKVFVEDEQIEAWKECNGDAASFILSRALGIVDSFGMREELVVKQVKEIIETVNSDPHRFMLLMGSDHFFIHTLLVRAGIDTRAYKVHPNSRSLDLDLATHIRSGMTYDERMVHEFGLAHWLVNSNEIANRLSPQRILQLLRRSHYSIDQLRTAESAFYDNPTVETLPYGIGDLVLSDIRKN